MNKQKKIIQIADNVFWLGIFLEKQLEINIYLRVFKHDSKTINLIIDPGPPVIFDELQKALSERLGSPSKVHFAFVNHQDPDVSTNLMYLKKYNPKLKVLCTEDTWRLINFLGLEPSNFQSIDKFKSKRGRLSTGHTVRFIPSPFCHFRGSAMLYDEESRILFSGDLFGGLTYSSGLFATPVNWHGIRTFHQIYMPSQKAIQRTIDEVRALSPKPEIIAPQHGAMIKGGLIDSFLDQLYELPVGLDMMPTETENKDLYLAAINEIIEIVSKKEGREIVDLALREVTSDGSFPDLFVIKDGFIKDIKVNPQKTFKLFIDALKKDKAPAIREHIKNLVLKASVDWNLPLYDSVIDSSPDSPDTLTIEQF